MFDKVNTIIGKLNLEMWLYVCLGIIAVVFVFGFIFSVATGELKRFKKVAKRSLKNPNLADVTNFGKALPVKARRLFNRVLLTGEKPSDVIGIEAVVVAPSVTSFAAKYSKIVLTTSAFMAALIFAVGNIKAFGAVNLYTSLALVVVAGLVLSFIAGIVSVCIRANAVKLFDKYVTMLDDVFKSGALIDQAEQTDKNNAIIDDIIASENADATQDTIVEPLDSKPATSVTEPVILEPTAAAAISEMELKAKAREQAALDEQARIQAEAQARFQAEAQAAKAAQAIIAAQAVKPEPVKPATIVSSADEVIARIEKISREGASFSTMKEVAQALQQERAKPENKTPEQARRLNESLTLLLKAMTSATKR